MLQCWHRCSKCVQYSRLPETGAVFACSIPSPRDPTPSCHVQTLWCPQCCVTGAVCCDFNIRYWICGVHEVAVRTILCTCAAGAERLARSLLPIAGSALLEMAALAAALTARPAPTKRCSICTVSSVC